VQKSMPNLWFRLMALEYRIKSRSKNAEQELQAAGIRRGMAVLDFGCGPGRYTIPAARIVGREGVVHAMDVHPLAIRFVQKKAEEEGLSNVHAIRSDCQTRLESDSMDVVLLYDALHDMEDKESVLREIYRVLKPEGRLLYKDHTNLVSLMLSSGFCLSRETPAQFALTKY